MTRRFDVAAARALYGQAPSRLEATLALHMEAVGLKPRREFQFQPPRRWRFDFAFPEQRLAIECEGGIWTGGRHVRAKGFQADAEKYNAATLAGWRVLRFTGDMVKSGEALAVIERALEGRPK
jgi:very-short-patch-repair endonuclease